jgi:uncharacterized protein YjbI with pentapeptide repeats
MKFDILDKSGKVIFVADVDCDENCDTASKIGMAVDYAIDNKISLIGTDLSGADLSGINLSCLDLIHANLSHTSLSGADLSGADLRYVDLSGADLREADLSHTNLMYASLSGANLRDADLSHAILSHTTLSHANLRDTDLSYANLSCADLRVVQTDIWTCYVQKEHIRISCQVFTVDEWIEFSDEEISKMDSKALAWWKIWKPILLSIVDTLKG